MGASILWFGRKSAAAAPAAKGAEGSPPAELVADPGNRGRLLAVGLRWRAIVQSPAEQQALEQARAARASHFQLQGYVFGHCRLTQEQAAQLKAGAIVYSAARLAAKRFGQNALIALRLDEQEIWLCQIRSGAPAAVDEVVRNEAEAVQRLHTLLAAFGDRSAVKIHSDLADLGQDVAFARFADLFAVQGVPVERVQPVPSSRALPKPVLLGVVALAALLVVQHGWNAASSYWHQLQQQKQAQGEEVDPDTLWQQAVDAWLARQVLVEGGQLEPVLASLAALPAHWHGWRLGEANCQLIPETFKADSVEWSCQASHQRSAAGDVNTAMKQRIPATFRVSFLPLEGMVLEWRVKSPARALSRQDLGKLPTRESHFVATSAALQRIAPAMAQPPRYAFQPAVVERPKDAKGVPVTPTTPFTVQTAALALDGPMRSLVRAAHADMPAAWSRVVVRLADGEQPPTLTASVVTGTLVGSLYASQ